MFYCKIVHDYSEATGMPTDAKRVIDGRSCPLRYMFFIAFPKNSISVLRIFTKVN